ncbi:MAG: chorismate-binding protein [Flavobacteriales bacterium]
MFKTTALAGTRLKLGKEVLWGEKEVMEQRVVLDYLIDTIKTDPQAKTQIHATETVEAAHLEHIRTNVEFESELGLDHWIEKLHPTPAVCGLPKDQAYNFIVKNELHSRKQYTGVVGITNAQNAKLFVQLRCAEFDSKTKDFWIYTGGGIMHDSDINSEWQEAENKANVMLNVLSELASQRI